MKRMLAESIDMDFAKLKKSLMCDDPFEINTVKECDRQLEFRGMMEILDKRPSLNEEAIEELENYGYSMQVIGTGKEARIESENIKNIKRLDVESKYQARRFLDIGSYTAIMLMDVLVGDWKYYRALVKKIVD